MMVIRKIVVEPENGRLIGSFDGEGNEILINTQKIFQVQDLETGLVITVSSQILRIKKPAIIHSEYLISQEHLVLDIPPELRISDKTQEELI